MFIEVLRRLARGFAQLATLVLALAGAAAQQPERPAAPSAAQIERMKEIYLPSAPHQTLAAFAGEWQQDVEYASGSGTPVRAAGPVINRVVLGGRFIVSEGIAKSKDMDVASMLVFGFDGRTREYTAVVFDTFGTYYVTATGAAPAGARLITMRGETPENGGTKKFDVVLRWIDQDTYRTEIVFHHAGRPPTVAVAATCRRVRSAAGF